ncbi:MAG: cytochrome C [Myxococcota bacterium]
MLNLKDKHLRWLVFALSAAACVAYAVAYFEPMWGWYLSAPQYPDGLVMSVYLDHVAGDTTEINILNHYIGMAKLEEAAQLERALAVYGVLGIGLIVLLGVFLPGRRYSKYFFIPSLVFPLVFLGMMYYWMYRFGHELSPDAPVTVPPFTPTLLGRGSIGNFQTLGLPGTGFYLVLLAGVLVAAAFWLRRRVCSGCKEKCGLTCPHLFVGSDRKTHPRLPVMR